MLVVWAMSSRAQVVVTEFHLYSCFLSSAMLIPAAASRGKVCRILHALHDQAFALFFLSCFLLQFRPLSPLLQVHDWCRVYSIRSAATAPTEDRFLKLALLAFIGAVLPLSRTSTILRAIARGFIPRYQAPNLGHNAAC